MVYFQFFFIEHLIKKSRDIRNNIKTQNSCSRQCSYFHSFAVKDDLYATQYSQFNKIINSYSKTLIRFLDKNKFNDLFQKPS